MYQSINSPLKAVAAIGIFSINIANDLLYQGILGFNQLYLDLTSYIYLFKCIYREYPGGGDCFKRGSTHLI